MTRKPGAALALLLAVLTALAGLSVPQAAADDYTADIETSCNIGVADVVRQGNQATIRINIRCNATVQPRGTVRLRVTTNGSGGSQGASVGGQGAAREVMSRSVRYNGSPVEVRTPELMSVGNYRATIAYTPDGGTSFQPCTAAVLFQVRQGVDNNNEGPDNENPGTTNPGIDVPDSGGILPNTGGPDLRWLALGVLLLGAGSGLVVAARRRRQSAFSPS